MLLDAGADVNLPGERDERRPLAVAARCGHLAAYDRLAARGATADLDDVDQAVRAVLDNEAGHSIGNAGGSASILLFSTAGSLAANCRQLTRSSM